MIRPHLRALRQPRPSRRLVTVIGLLALTSAIACSSLHAPTEQAAVPTSAPAPATARGAAQAVSAPAASVANAGGAVASTGAAQAVPAASPGAPSADAVVADSSAQILDRMVIRTAQLTVEVQDMESALSKARDIAASAGGFVSASNTHVENADSH